MQNLTIVDHPLVQHKLTIMRCKDTSTAGFRRLLREIAHLLCYEVTRDLEVEMIEIETPVRRHERAHAQGQEARLRLDPARGQRPARRHARPRALGPRRPYRALPRPRNPRSGRILFQGAVGRRRQVGDRCRSHAGDGQFSNRGGQKLKDRGANNLRFLCLLAAPEGVERFTKAHPDVPVYTASVDEKLNEHGYIVPGLGDAGDRMYGTR